MGLLKKAAELSILCDVKLILSFKDLNGSIVSFSSCILEEEQEFSKPDYTFNTYNYPQFNLQQQTFLELQKRSLESFPENFSFANLPLISQSQKKIKKEDLECQHDMKTEFLPPKERLYNPSQDNNLNETQNQMNQNISFDVFLINFRLQCLTQMHQIML